MTNRRSAGRPAPTLLLAALLATAAGAADETTWDGEVGLLAGSHDNFFFRGGDQPAPSSDLLTGYVALSRDHDVGAAEWAVGFRADMVAVADVDNADYQALEVEGQYKRGPWKASLAYGQLLNRLYSESGEAVFFDQSGFDLWLRYSVNRRLWLRARVEIEDQDFDSLQDDRDADVVSHALTARYALSDALGLRVSYLGEDRDATGPENNRTGEGFALAFEGTPSDRLTWFLRLRSRDRRYEDAPVDASNFGRRDTIEDINFNVRWLLRDQIGLMLRDSYRSGDSTRPDRNFTGNVVEVGVFFQFGSSTIED